MKAITLQELMRHEKHVFKDVWKPGIYAFKTKYGKIWRRLRIFSIMLKRKCAVPCLVRG